MTAEILDTKLNQEKVDNLIYLCELTRCITTEFAFIINYMYFIFTCIYFFKLTRDTSIMIIMNIFSFKKLQSYTHYQSAKNNPNP